jgi:hypothetical protein
MVDKNTPAEILKLAEALDKASYDLRQMLAEVLKVSNEQLAAAATFFIECKNEQPGSEFYGNALQDLLTVAAATSDIRALVQQSSNISSGCSYLRHAELSRALKKRNLQVVCENT